MLYEYIQSNYQVDEPIFLSELPGKSINSIRQEMKKITDEGKLERLFNGVYYQTYTTILGTKGRVSVEKYIEKKFLYNDGKRIGYTTGLQFANEFGFTTQNPACFEVCSNEASTKQRKITIDGKQLIIYMPVEAINETNKSALQFLDFMSNADKYSEIKGEEFKKKIKRYVSYVNLDYDEVKRLLPLYPDKLYRNLYDGGVMNELV